MDGNLETPFSKCTFAVVDCKLSAVPWIAVFHFVLEKIICCFCFENNSVLKKILTENTQNRVENNGLIVLKIKMRGEILGRTQNLIIFSFYFVLCVSNSERTSSKGV